ncbi:hypothetical protein [Alicyclobacillus sp.]|uniref:hypothetical protein n=1 Tax=Alicyclobacillus sp. TaxID=61169 RepID=UPI0025BE2A7D|nr:hypothetical protein [Alicyclobacillus sp.]MCL6516013.1 hypothetical protein [Alicyclobacillus sp.]
MVDVLLLAVIVWCALGVRARSAYDALAVTGGVVAAGYAAVQASGWVIEHWFPEGSPAMTWVERHVRAQADPVMARAAWIPPEPTFTWGSHAQWIAVHVLQYLFVVMSAAAVLLMFLAVSWLSDALWDRASRPRGRMRAAMAWACGVFCGLYVAALTGVALANLTWLDAFSWVSDAVRHSVGVKVLAGLAQWRGFS